MEADVLLRKLARRGADKEKLAAAVLRQPRLLPAVVGGLGADQASVKYGCAKILRIVSERDPARLYPRMKTFVDHLDHDNQILKWNAIIIIGHLAVVDSKGRIDRILNRYLRPISGPALVTASNTISGAANIALAKPRLTDRIVDRLLSVENARFPTIKCRHIAAGRVIDALDRVFEQTKRKERVTRFVKKQLTSPRGATKKRAERFVKKRLRSA
jgi:hypothetical protein